VPIGDVVFFTRQLSTMFSAGMTVERALDSLSASEKKPKFKKVLVHLASDIKKGQSLSEAVARHPGVFSRLYVALIRSGEVGGALGEVLDKLADYLERTEDIQRRVISSLYYPVFVLIFLSVCVSVLVLKVAPMFNRVYKSFGAELPLPTLVLMNVSNALIHNAVFGAAVLLCIAAGAFVFSQTDQGRTAIDSLKLRFPVIGGLIGNSIMATFSRTFGLLLSTSVPVLDSLNLVSQVVNNVIIEKCIIKARSLIRDGFSIYNALSSVKVFPSILVQLAATGEETGELDALLFKAAQYYEKQVEALVNRLTSIIEPVLIVLMGMVVGTLVIIIYLPIFYLGMAMKRGMK
jgi:type IV pilus assembly protein PilC